MKGSSLGSWCLFILFTSGCVQKVELGSGLSEFSQARGSHSPRPDAGVGVMAHLQPLADPRERHGAALAQPNLQGRFLRRSPGQAGQFVHPQPQSLQAQPQQLSGGLFCMFAFGRPALQCWRPRLLPASQAAGDSDFPSARRRECASQFCRRPRPASPESIVCPGHRRRWLGPDCRGP